MKSQGNSDSPQPTPKRLKILYVITQGTWGGAQRYVFDLATSLAPQHEVLVAIGESNGSPDLQTQLQKSGVKIQQLQHLVRPISPVHDILAPFELHKLYKEFQPDIIHLNSSKAGIIGSLTHLFTRKPVDYKTIYTVHGWVFLEPISPFIKSLYKFLEKITAHWKDVFILLSPEEKDISTKVLRIPDSKLNIIPLGIQAPYTQLTQLQAREKLEQKLKISLSTKKIVGTIAGLYKTKGLDTYIQTLGKNKDKLPQNTAFVLIGEGPERKLIESLISEYKLSDHVFLTGSIENAAELLPAFDVFVLPSKKEGLPYTLLEAISFNIPIIATPVGGIPSLLENYPKKIITDFSSLLNAIQQTLLNTTIATPLNKSPSTLQSMTEATVKLYYSMYD